MLKKVWSSVATLAVVCGLFAGCQTKPLENPAVVSSQVPGSPSSSVAGENQPAENKTKIGLVVGTGGLGDQNFNDMAYNGLKEAEAAYGIAFDYSEPQSVAEFESHISRFAQEGSYDLIIVSTNEAQTAVDKLAEQYPDQRFTIVDAKVERPNVKSILKDFAEMTFLNGYLAGMMTTDTSIPNMTDKAVVGMILGLDIPNMQNGARGFTAGAKLAYPEADVRIGIAGAFNDPAKAKEIAKSMYDDGADIILNFSGGSGLGIINQAKESALYVMGGASNQNPDAPDTVIASAIENLKDKVKSEAEEIVNGSWQGGEDVGVLANSYVGITFEGSNVPVSDEMKSKLDALNAKVVAGEIVLPKDGDDIAKWATENQDKLS